MIVSCIVATAENSVIGMDNQIPWYLPADLRFFKKTTINHHVIMGRKCFQSIGKALPKRSNIIISRNPFYIVSNCLIAHSIPEALSMAYENGEEEAFIIGGAEIYKQTQSLWDRLYLTKIHARIEGDTFFPEINFDNWKIESEIHHKADEKNKYDYSYLLYSKLVSCK